MCLMVWKWILIKHASDYNRIIRESGGVDLQLLGLGNNGHIGFNEPGEAFGKRNSLR